MMKLIQKGTISRSSSSHLWRKRRHGDEVGRRIAHEGAEHRGDRGDPRRLPDEVVVVGIGEELGPVADVEIRPVAPAADVVVEGIDEHDDHRERPSAGRASPVSGTAATRASSLRRAQDSGSHQGSRTEPRERYQWAAARIDCPHNAGGSAQAAPNTSAKAALERRIEFGHRDQEAEVEQRGDATLRPRDAAGHDAGEMLQVGVEVDGDAVIASPSGGCARRWRRSCPRARRPRSTQMPIRPVAPLAPHVEAREGPDDPFLEIADRSGARPARGASGRA